MYAFLGTEFGWYPDFDAPTLAPDEAAIFRSPLPFRAKYPGRYGPSPVQLFRPSRDGTNFVFQYFSWDGGIFSVQRSTSLSTGAWRTILTEAANPTNFVVTVTIPVEVNGAAFYRVHTLRLLNPSRAGSEFRFQFYAEEGVRYQVSRSASFTGAPWIPVLSIEGAGALVTAIDPAATATTAYYRLEY